MQGEVENEGQLPEEGNSYGDAYIVHMQTIHYGCGLKHKVGFLVVQLKDHKVIQDQAEVQVLQELQEVHVLQELPVQDEAEVQVLQELQKVQVLQELTVLLDQAEAQVLQE